MPSAPELAQLKDIHLPHPISWWPLAPGWYVLAFACLVLVVVILFKLRQKRLHNKPKQQALHLLATYQKNYRNEGNALLASARISELLKRVALVYFPREQIASLNGKDWLEFLNGTAKGIDFNTVSYELLELPYRQDAASRDLSPLFDLAKIWIQKRKKPCLS